MKIRRITITGKPDDIFCKASHDCGYVTKLAPVLFASDINCFLTGRFMFKLIIMYKLWERPQVS